MLNKCSSNVYTVYTCCIMLLLLLLLMMMMMSMTLTVSPHEVMVRKDDLKLCKDDNRVCVSDLRDCGRPPPSAQTLKVNMTCYYQESRRNSSMTCELSLESDSVTEPDISLIFSRKYKVSSCAGIFSRAAVLTITARIQNYVTASDIRSQPHTVFLYDAVKPSQPVVSALNSTDDSVAVIWRSNKDRNCRLRYRVNSSQVWSMPPDFVPVHRNEMLVYTIKDLLPFTVYTVAVACRGGTWSDWSRDITVRTLDRVPSTSPQLCYRVEKTDSGSTLLHLMWKDLDFYEAGGRVLGYQVTYEPVKTQRPGDILILNVTEVIALLVVEEGNCTVTVTAFNAAGYGPTAHLSVDTQRHKPLPSITKLWVSPLDKGLLLQWKIPSSPSITSLVVVWHSETHPSTRHTHWVKVDANNTSLVLQDFDPDESCLISVFTVHQQQCGAPQSLPASLQQGALMEADRLKVAAVTKTSVTVEWAWQRRSGPIGVSRYRVMLTQTSHRQDRVQVVPLWLEQQQHHHTFTSLSPDTQYSLYLLADNVSTNIVPVRTEFDNVPVVVTATTLLLFVITVLIICILSRTVYKSFFFPPISSPRGSTSGQWLMDPNKQISSDRNILDIKNFQVTEESVSVVQPKSLLSSQELQEDGLLPLQRLFSNLGSDYVSDPQLGAEKRQSYHPHHHPDRFTSEETEDNVCLLHQTHEANKCFSPLNLQTSHQTTALCLVRELLADTDGPRVYQITCDAEYLVNSSFPGNPEPKRESGQTKANYMTCEADYIANDCFTAENAKKEDGANNVGDD